MFGKKIFCQTHSNKVRKWISKIPKACLITVLLITVTASIIRDMTLGDKIEENDKRTCLAKKFFSQTHSNKAGNGFENSKGA